MGTSSLTVLNLELNPITVYRNTLWYDRYQLCLHFHLREASCLRGWSHKEIDRVIQIRQQWQRRINFGGSWQGHGFRNEMDPVDIENLHSMVDFVKQIQDDHKITISGNHVYVYTNSWPLINTILDLDFVDRLRSSLREAVAQGQSGTVRLRDPQFQNRSFFRYQALTTQQAQSLQQFLLNQDDIGLSPTLRRWCETPITHGQRTQDYWFFDHDGQGTVYMMSLIVPRLIRRTLPVVPYK